MVKIACCAWREREESRLYLCSSSTVDDSHTSRASGPRASNPDSYRPVVPGVDRRAGFGGEWGLGKESVAKQVGQREMQDPSHCPRSSWHGGGV